MYISSPVPGTGAVFYCMFVYPDILNYGTFQSAKGLFQVFG